MFLALSLFFPGCEQSYPEEKIQASLAEICKTEYGIDHVETKIVGKTIGVYLPLEKIFSTDFEEMLAGGKVKDLSSLLQIAPETLDKVEDVLFSTSRVILSTNKPLDFYVLKATDTEITGITLILVGYVPDIKRVRFWDISRSEYRKRVFHDLKVNYPVIWKKPVVGVFKSIGSGKNAREILDSYFLPGANLESISPLFYSLLLETKLKDNIAYTILDVRSTAGRQNEALVYVKVREDYKAKAEADKHPFILPSGFEAEYIFVLNKYLGEYKISRVIPFYYVAEDGSIKNVNFPPELKLYENLEKWHEEFELEEVILEDFLAQQITRRVQSDLLEDERILNTFATQRLNFKFVPDAADKAKGYFTLQVTANLKKPLPEADTGLTIESIRTNEDILYLFDVALREFLTVIRGYWFDNYDRLEISLWGATFVLSKGDLELYRKKKLKIDELLLKALPT